jgi:hypothetical protein
VSFTFHGLDLSRAHADKSGAWRSGNCILFLPTSTTMTKTYSHTFDSHVFKGTVEIPTGIFINGQWTDGSEGKTIECVARSPQLSRT